MFDQALTPQLSQRSLGKYVALKVAVALNTTIRSEVDTLTKLGLYTNTLATPQLPVPKLLDSFALKGPNGVHSVLVLEPLGRTLQQFITEMQLRLGTDQGYRDVGVLRELSRQIVYAVCYIHSKGIVHRDIYPGNVMFALNNPLETVNEADLDEHTRLRWSQNVFPLRRVDGKPLTIHSPTYVVEPQPLDSKTIETSPLSTSRLVLSDFGAATTFENSNDGYHAYPAASRPPEVLLGLPVSEKSDIWALGCTIFHLVTLGDIFYVDSFKKGVEQDDEHLQSMIEVLGLMPERMLQLWKGRQSVLDEDGNLLEEHVEDPFSDPLDVQISERKPNGMSSKDASAFESFIRSIFQYEPKERPSAEELLRHRWLTEENAYAKVS
ncbi:MAG: hypothetical protein Q9187_000979 [Circinaria calcarea]